MLLGTLDYKRQYAMDRRSSPVGGASSSASDHAALLLSSSSSSLPSASVPVRLQPMLPFPHERMLVTLSFMMCVALGCAVLLLGGFHLYLAATAQTTIEFHANWSLRRRDPKHRNPYSLGSWRKNVEQVFGTPVVWRALLPRSGPPTHLPVPLPGRDNRRKRHAPLRPSKEPLHGNGLVPVQQRQGDAAWIV
jgi:hypothetical protein